MKMKRGEKYGNSFGKIRAYKLSGVYIMHAVHASIKILLIRKANCVQSEK
jgi:hypothetical protein